MAAAIAAALTAAAIAAADSATAIAASGAAALPLPSSAAPSSDTLDSSVRTTPLLDARSAAPGLGVEPPERAVEPSSLSPSVTVVQRAAPGDRGVRGVAPPSLIQETLRAVSTLAVDRW